ncbi:hypothetical protein C8R47DRAFT_1171126, partial [Mycena vitilis]
MPLFKVLGSPDSFFGYMVTGHIMIYQLFCVQPNSGQVAVGMPLACVHIMILLLTHLPV